ncbi:hypothetical protein GCM10009841_08150 [Microlunatus panaciterrae]
MISTFAERPEYIERVAQMADAWPGFMRHGIVSNALLWQVVPSFPELCVVATVDDVPIARARAVPFALRAAGRGELPDDGWDRVLSWALADKITSIRPDTVSALEIAVDPAHLGQGLSMAMLAELRTAAARAGFNELVAPVRPTHKHRQPTMPMDVYAAQLRGDGLPLDPWLRVHVRAGGRIERVAHTSMVIAGSLAAWRGWTRLPFDRSGEVVVPQALVPVRCEAEHNYAVYVEPNVWVRHTLING